MKLTENQKLYAEIVKKAWEDADFKAKLVANPVATIEELTGRKVDLPEGKRVVVRDQTDENKVFINIPTSAASESEDVELNEEQLEAVSGGAVYPIWKLPNIGDILRPTPTFPDNN